MVSAWRWRTTIDFRISCDDFDKDKKVIIVVCGGSKISVDTLVQYKARYGERARELAEMWNSS